MSNFLRNPIQLRLEKLTNWQLNTFMACLCERMAINFKFFCLHTEYEHNQAYRGLLNVIWESLVVKKAKIDFDKQLEKLANIIPITEDYDCYAVYPAVDACIALSHLLHSQLDHEQLLDAAVKVSQLSVMSIVQLEAYQNQLEITDHNQKEHTSITEEWDIQWDIYRELRAAEQYDTLLINELKKEIQQAGQSNLGIQC